MQIKDSAKIESIKREAYAISDGLFSFVGRFLVELARYTTTEAGFWEVELYQHKHDAHADELYNSSCLSRATFDDDDDNMLNHYNLVEVSVFDSADEAYRCYFELVRKHSHL